MTNIADETGWELWYAWRPVLIDHRIVWRKHIERRRWNGRWQYRRIGSIDGIARSAARTGSLRRKK